MQTLRVNVPLMHEVRYLLIMKLLYVVSEM